MAFNTKPIKSNLVLDTDSYKHGHSSLINPDLESAYLYGEARVGGEYNYLAWCGIQAIVAKYLLTPITVDDIHEAVVANTEYHGKNTLDVSAWMHVVENCGGILPITIKIVPEGTILEKGNALFTIHTEDPIVAKIIGNIEALFMHVWYPSSVLTRCAEIKSRLYPIFLKTGSVDSLEFAVHDFGLRGTTCMEHGGIGGLGHSIAFRGSDNYMGSRVVNHFYNGGYPSKSVYATEHSVALSFGSGQGEFDYINHVLDVVPDDMIASIVIDTYDAHGFIRNIAGDEDVMERIKNREGRVVFRPDSGNPLSIPVQIIELLGEIYGYTMNASGYKVLNHNIGVLQGDGMNKDSIVELYKILVSAGWAASNLVVGSGGGLLVEGLSRDTHRFAIKLSYGLIAGVRTNFTKRPLTDMTKQSKGGEMKVLKGYNSRYQTITTSTITAASFNAHIDSMRIIFENGKYYPESFASIKSRFDEHLALLTTGVIC